MGVEMARQINSIKSMGVTVKTSVNCGIIVVA